MKTILALLTLITTGCTVDSRNYLFPSYKYTHGGLTRVQFEAKYGHN
jgi:hypothetical protein